jgi:succinate dehydrogenase/fumarate reductase flavoprotein subunit
VEHWDIETDVAVVGYGGAGSCAAIEAADCGAEVVIFEQASAPGGSTALSSAEIYLGGSGGTRVQKACGFTDNTEDMFNYLMMCAGPQADEAKIRNYCEYSVSHFDWLVQLGVPFKDSFHEARAIMCLTDDGLLYTGSEKAFPFREQAKPAP